MKKKNTPPFIIIRNLLYTLFIYGIAFFAATTGGLGNIANTNGNDTALNYANIPETQLFIAGMSTSLMQAAGAGFLIVTIFHIIQNHKTQNQ